MKFLGAREKVGEKEEKGSKPRQEKKRITDSNSSKGLRGILKSY